LFRQFYSAFIEVENADKEMNSDKPRKYSQKIVDGAAQAPSRSMLRAVGFGDEDFKKSQVGIASTWSMVTPCNMHINTLAEEVNFLYYNEKRAWARFFMASPFMRYAHGIHAFFKRIPSFNLLFCSS
jgi:hypothetical protein